MFAKECAAFEVRALSASTTEIDLYDEIGGWGVTAAAFREALAQVKTPELILNINSPGGDIFDGIAIYNDILAHEAYVVVRVSGLAASAASVVAMAADRIEIGSTAFLMIHNAWTVAIGDNRELTERAALLRDIDQSIASTYATRTDLDPQEIAEMMNNETWMNGKKAVALGFADKLTDEAPETSAHFDLAAFKSVPRALKQPRHKVEASASPAKTAATDDLSPILAMLEKLQASLAH